MTYEYLVLPIKKIQSMSRTNIREMFSFLISARMKYDHALGNVVPQRLKEYLSLALMRLTFRLYSPKSMMV